MQKFRLCNGQHVAIAEISLATVRQTLTGAAVQRVHTAMRHLSKSDFRDFLASALRLIRNTHITALHISIDVVDLELGFNVVPRH